jgi:methylated-DNA-[protein]-cysteine S-methyltransferase
MSGEAVFSAAVESPIGPLQLFASDVGLRALYLPNHKRPLSFLSESKPEHPLLREARGQLAEYFAGARTAFELPLEPPGTPFQQTVWSALREIPLGETRTYLELAVQLGNPKATRAVGAANGRNPLSIIVPCHRVIGSSGALTGYAGGESAKRWLLRHEQSVAGRAGFTLTSR